MGIFDVVSGGLLNKAMKIAVQKAPSLAKGTKSVPKTGIYKLHAGEMVIPKSKVKKVRSVAGELLAQGTKHKKKKKKK